MRKCSIVAALLLLGACGEDRPPAPTAEEGARLDEAEAMLNEEGATPDSAAPSDSD